MSDKLKKYYTPEERDEQVFSVEGKHNYKSAVHEDLAGSIEKEVSRNYDYTQRGTMPGNLDHQPGSQAEPYVYQRSDSSSVQDVIHQEPVAGSSNYSYRDQSTVQQPEYYRPIEQTERRYESRQEPEQTHHHQSYNKYHYPAPEPSRPESRYPDSMARSEYHQSEDSVSQLLHTNDGSVIHQHGAEIHRDIISAEVQYHRQADTLRDRERIAAVEYDGDIDLDQEKTRSQLGFRSYEEDRPTGNLSYRKYGSQSDAERHSHKNDVEQNSEQYQSRYGTVEKTDPDKKKIVGGAAGTAAVVGAAGAAGIIKTDDRTVFQDTVKAAAGDAIKGTIKVSEAAAFQEKVWGHKKAGKGGVLLTAAELASREIDARVGQGGDDGTIEDRSKGQAQKYGYKAGKYAAVGGFAVGRGTFRIARLGKKLSADVSSGVLTSKEAKDLLRGQVKESVLGSGAAVGGLIKDGSIHAVEDFRGSDDLGMQAITKPKDIIVGTRRTLKMAKTTGHTVKKTVTTTKNIAARTAEAGKAAVAGAKKLFSNPIVLKGIGIVGIAVVIVIAVLGVLSGITSVFPALSLKSEDYELSETYLYITELDARMEEDIINEDTRLHIPPIDEYHYYLNGASVSKDDMEVYTNADLLLAYLDSKYQDFVFTGIFGSDIKTEVGTIHGELHKVDKTRWTEEIEHTSTSTDPVTGESHTSTWIEYVYHMDISLSTRTWESYYEENKDTLLDDDQKEQYDALQEVGVYSFRKMLASPFVGTNWLNNVSSRWGWRIHPISGELKQHLGLDIGMAGGTPINACNAGTVVRGNDPNGWGQYIKVVAENGDYTLYGHMSGYAAADGQTVKAGDVIGYVGTTGASTGNHLHLEYHQSGKNLNPLIFTECDE